MSDTPYADALRAFAARTTVRLNVPGHQSENAAPSPLVSFFGKDILALDVPPLTEGLDKAATPGEIDPLSQSLALAAKTFGASRVWFLTNGASQANRIAQLALGQFRSADDPIVAQRSAHSSFIDGVILAGTRLAFVLPSICRDYGINHGVTVDALRASLDENPHAKAAYVVSPSYFGAVADVAGLADVAHERGIPLIVDAAWGAHFGFHPDLPQNPLALGADLVISSTHKLGGSLTQSAMLLLGSTPFAVELEPLIERSFVLTQSTSASSLLLASLDIARSWLDECGAEIKKSVIAADRLRAKLRENGFAVVSDDFSRFPDIVAADPLRVSFDVRTLGLTGHAVRELLMSEYGIYTEISTETCVVAIVAPGHDVDAELIVAALMGLAASHGNRAASDKAQLPLELPLPGATVMRPRDAYFAATEIVPASSAVGRVSADSLAAYPPGIPNVLPGEIITADTVAFLQSVARAPGGYVRGALNHNVDHFRVVSG